MNRVFINESANRVSDIQTRRAHGLGSFLVDGILKVRELSGNPGAAGSVVWRDNFTGEIIDTVAFTEGAGASGTISKIPYNYTLETTGLVNGAIIDAGIDGDAP